MDRFGLEMFQHYCLDFEAHHQAAAASSARWSGLRHAVIARSVRLFLCHRSCHVSASDRRCYCLDASQPSYRSLSFLVLTQAAALPSMPAFADITIGNTVLHSWLQAAY
jgi:hypothetical protein